MNFEEFAYFYVNVIIPIWNVARFVFLGIFIVWFFMLLRSGEKKGEMINAIVSGVWKGTFAVITFFGLSIAWVFKFTVRIITVIFASIRDFFTSEV